jgi:CRP/FNR family transcriptional regulator, cyclic AMP receptor protein
MKKILYIFGEMDDRDVSWLSTHGETLTVPEGHILVERGKELSHLYLLLEGELNVELSAGNFVAVGPGEVIGELSFVDRRPPSATVVAAMDSRVLSIDKALLEAKLTEDRSFAANFYRALAVFLSTRLRGTVGRLGYGEGDEGDYQEDEIDLNELTNTHLGGERFDRLLKAVRSPNA